VLHSFLAWLDSLSGFFAAYGVIGLFLVSFAESSFLPILPDLLLIPLCALRPTWALWYALVATVASVLGSIFGRYLGVTVGRSLLLRFTSAQFIDKLDRAFARFGGWAVFVAGFTPLPYKLFTIASGVFKLSTPTVIFASALGRGGRFFLEAALVVAFGRQGPSLISHYIGPITGGLAALVVAAWLLGRKTAYRRRLTDWGSRLLARARVISGLRLGRLGDLGSYLIIALSLAGFFALVLTNLIANLLAKQLQPFDTTVAGVIDSLRGPVATAVTNAATYLGSLWFLVPVGLVAAAAIYRRRRRWAEGWALLVSWWGAWVLSELLKDAFERPRPAGTVLAHAGDFSFPCGETMVASAFYGVLAYVLWTVGGKVKRRGTPGGTGSDGMPGRGALWGPLAGAASLGAMVTLATSRVYLGVHYPSDVAAGLAFGGLWALACISWLRLAASGERRVGGVDGDLGQPPDPGPISTQPTGQTSAHRPQP